MSEGSARTILIAEDSEIDRLMAEQAWSEGGSSDELGFVQDGQELMDCLHNRPLPAMILLDLKLPVKGGFEALAEIKADPELRQIPVVIMTASKSSEDRNKAYAMDASCFVTKPDSLEALVTLMKALHLLNVHR